MSYWERPHNLTLTRMTCRCLLFHSRETPGLWRFLKFCAEKIDNEVRLFLNESKNHITQDFSRPGNPTDNPFIESFNGSFREECLNTNWFLSLEDAMAKIENRRIEFNRLRQHSSLNDRTPHEVFYEYQMNAGNSILARVC